MAQSLQTAPRAREAYGAPRHPSDPLVLQPSPRQIRFLHPGYPDEHSLLLVLPALDSPNGIHHQTALDACAIVADSRWDGFFTLDRQGAERVSTDDMGVSLAGDAYYFQVPGSDGIDKDYPVVPTFAEWRFPHTGLPTRWLRDPIFDANSTRRCLLSNAVSLPETAHIVPQNPADEEWFNENGMAIYGPLHSSTNTMRFKVDVHQYFDRKPKFVIVPKYDKMVVHIFNCQSIEAREAIELFHNVPVAITEQSSRFLLARLAWTIFPLLETFLRKGVKRRLLRKTDDGFVVREENAHSCTQAWLSARPRSASPSKRPRNSNTEAQDAPGSDFEGLGDWEERIRGRKRRRRSSEYGTLDSQSTDSNDYVSSGSEVSESRDAKLLQCLRT